METSETNTADQSLVRRQKLDVLREQNRAYPHNIKVENTTKDILSDWGKVEDADKLASSPTFSLAGRVVFIRTFGKAGFVKIRDRDGEIQSYVSNKETSEQDFNDFKSLDLGDIVKVTGILFRTKTGELSIKAKSFSVLVKSLHTPPEKFHGLQDVEEKYRKRYLDLISNSETRDRFILRSKIIQKIREFFINKEFIEVETPMMHPLVSGAAARPFTTHHNALDMNLYLRVAPELYLKRLVVGGMDRVFEINRNFRNEGISIRHNPEFTMLEFYQAYATYQDLMNTTEELFSSLAKDLLGTCEVEFLGHKINLASPWKRLSVENAVIQLSNFKGDLKSVDEMKNYLKSKGVDVAMLNSPGKLLMEIFDQDCEEKLIQPTFITHYPVEVSPLARRSEDKSENGFDVTDRFELFIAGTEIANGFNELNDPDDQAKRFKSQLEDKAAGDDEACDFDEDYITALEYGLPPTAGEGIGIDRLVMLLTNSSSIRDILLFPLMKKK